MKFILIVILVVINFPLYKRVFNFMFESMEDFNESLRYVFTPDIFSLFKGEYMRDYLGELKIGMFLMICGVLVFLEYYLISLLFGF
ncbi:hypothetical protein EZV73_09495 [Acidaminobacter sp. JC074]|uniref:hypothetical protein n=1 Tax=Acidaminobacter sp. JC074 TaxID=2530199 RepID=UPI001F113762|nr:hypothetical protein [Acidaminobacter sp. JC074]MCH4887807.1 hypothetical protein [Acidaminobacter sp. JC074]